MGRATSNDSPVSRLRTNRSSCPATNPENRVPKTSFLFTSHHRTVALSDSHQPHRSADEWSLLSVYTHTPPIKAFPQTLSACPKLWCDPSPSVICSYLGTSTFILRFQNSPRVLPSRVPSVRAVRRTLLCDGDLIDVRRRALGLMLRSETHLNLSD